MENLPPLNAKKNHCNPLKVANGLFLRTGVVDRNFTFFSGIVAIEVGKKKQVKHVD